MVNFIMLVGLQGSGKSSYASYLADKVYFNSVIHSSDSIRKELFGDESIQDDNDRVFSEMSKRTIRDLKAGKNVIYDATNIRRKSRVALLRTLPDCHKVAIVVATPFDTCVERCRSRERVVEESVIARTRYSFNFPLKSEGFSEIKIVYPEEMIFNSPFSYLTKSYHFEQDNPHHTKTLGRHLLASTNYLLTNYTPSDELLYATLLHDVGKLYTKTFTNIKGEQTDIAHYYNHANVGAYECLFINMPSEDIRNKVITLVEFHMRPLEVWGTSSKAMNRDIQLLGEELYHDLLILNECDRAAH